VFLTIVLISPFSTLAISKKFSSSVDANVFLASVSKILNLCAPGALTFDEPAALSFNDASSFGVTKDSVTVKPTL